MKNPAAKKFKEALEEWDAYKALMAYKLNTGKITRSEYDRLMRNKAEELDL